MAWAAEAQELEKGLPRVLWKGPENKYFRLCRPSSLSHSYSPLFLLAQSRLAATTPVSMALPQ